LISIKALGLRAYMFSENLCVDDRRLCPQIQQDIERGGCGDKFEIMIMRKTRADFATIIKTIAPRIASVR
jgi:hypothetical protein